MLGCSVSNQSAGVALVTVRQHPRGGRGLGGYFQPVQIVPPRRERRLASSLRLGRSRRRRGASQLHLRPRGSDLVIELVQSLTVCLVGLTHPALELWSVHRPPPGLDLVGTDLALLVVEPQLTERHPSEMLIVSGGGLLLGVHLFETGWRPHPAQIDPLVLQILHHRTCLETSDH